MARWKLLWLKPTARNPATEKRKLNYKGAAAQTNPIGFENGNYEYLF